MLCKQCGGNNIRKQGKTPQGKQRFLCQEEGCGHSFILDYSYKGYLVEIRQKIVDMTRNGSSIREISRLLGVSSKTIMKIVKESELPAIHQQGFESMPSSGREPIKHDMARLLLIDDKETFLRVAADLLRRKGYWCDCATDVMEAAKALETQSYDVLIIDISLPGNGELEFLHSRHRSQPHVPVIGLTDSPSVQMAAKALHLEGVDYLVNPLDFSKLLHSIRLALAQSQTLQTPHQAHEALPEPSRDLEVIEKVPLALGTNDTEGGPARPGQQGYAEPPPDVCALVGCSRRLDLERGLWDAIMVIRQTKSAFRSKALAELRERLEALLRHD